MKKRITGLALTVIMTTALVMTGALKVSAEPDLEAEQEEIVQDESMLEKVKEDTEEVEMSETVSEIPESDAEEKTEEDFEITPENQEEEAEVMGMKVTLENTLEGNLVSIQVKSFMQDTYSDNLLPAEKMLNIGESLTIGIPEEFQDKDLGLYDVMITDENGTVTEIPVVPFLEEISGTLYREEGLVLIRICDERLEAEAEQISETEITQQEAIASQIMADALVEEIQ